MRILIVGAGEVGTHLAEMLSHEQHDIILLDSNPDNLEFAYDNRLEIMPFVGSPTSFKDLKDAGAGQADLLIAVTPEESTNIVTCNIATQMGAKKTLARINNSEYLQDQYRDHFTALGIDDMLYPEELAAAEIVSSLSLPWAKQYWSIFNKKLDLVATRVIKDSPLLGKELMELSDLSEKVLHVLAIVRDYHTIIPRGHDTIEEDDILYVAAKPQDLEKVRQFCGQQKLEVHRVIIMGGSRIAVKTAQALPDHLNIKIIESDYDKCMKLSEIVPENTLVIHGDSRDPDLLINEGIKKTDAFLALTSSSESNMLATLNAKRLGVPISVCQIENLDYLDIANEMKIGNLINKKLLAASAIFRYLLNIDISSAKTLSIGQGEVLEIKVRENSLVTKCPVMNLEIPAGITFGGILRNNEVLLVEGKTQINPGDMVMVFSHNASVNDLNKLFG
ncbi:MAG: Trk system potassium transporter TrkA [Bacteroidales bacterium]|uniref:Trk system potassium transporter TrkA n=1 Tax=Porphyromonas sp. TaxID=1924944 RepID=UPI002970673B|nr:Trk system potassium transporter TrkA [Porphyromonas sp.]MDD7438093.1 Trk system potassium transporter TrkA [Bacteroidales bacterium]MDY3067060.1 Trk system potassium transporter TrkA [Porphyromonas sp.]